MSHPFSALAVRGETIDASKGEEHLGMPGGMSQFVVPERAGVD
jgi:hypothetical protein